MSAYGRRNHIGETTSHVDQTEATRLVGTLRVVRDLRLSQNEKVAGAAGPKSKA